MVDNSKILNLLAEMRGEADGLRSIDAQSVTKTAITIEAMANRLAEMSRQIQQR